MTKKKDIVRRPVYALPDGSPVPSMGKGFTAKESRFIYWYTCPGTEAFMNSGRAAARAGYKGNAVMQGYLLRQKPRIAEKINAYLELSKIELRNVLYRAMNLLQIRMFFDVKDFYRDCKRTIKIKGTEIEVNSIEAIPLSELSWEQRMCVDQVTIKTINGKDEWWYKLPNRDKTIDLFLKHYKRLFPEKDDQEIDWKATAEIIREKPVIAPRDGKPPKNAIEAL
jgi:hypothetical protein